MKNNKFNLLIQFIFIFNCIEAQNLEGYVYDKQSLKHLPFVNVCIKGSTIGTITNSNGYFSLNIPQGHNNSTLSFSYIGYKATELSINSIPKVLTIQLEKTTINIQEVIINSDSTMFTLLKNAYKKIPENYGTTPSILTGFYRESVKEKDSLFIYIVESVIESYKTSYNNKEKGQVKVLKSRKNIAPNINEKNNVKFYGGLFVVHDKDIVHNRNQAINPKNFKQYYYEYNGIKPYGDKKVYSFSYSKADSNIYGVFFIDRESLAYVYYDYNKGPEEKSSNLNIKRNSSHYKIQYTFANGKWFLKSFISLSEITNKTCNTNLVLMSDYVTTRVDYSNIESPKYSEQIEYTTIFSDIATTYTKSYWKDYDILKLDTLSSSNLDLQINYDDANNILKKKYKQSKTGKDILISILLNTYFDFSIGYHESSYPASNMSISSEVITLTNNTISNDINVVYNSTIGYKLTKNISVEYKEQKGINKNIANKSFNIGISYIVPLKRGGKQFFVIPNLAYLNSYGGYKVGFTNISNSITVDGNAFKNSVNVYAGKKYEGVTIGMVLKTNITNMLHLIVGTNYHHYITTRDMFQIEDKSGLYKKKAYIPFNNDIEYYEDGEKSYSSSFQLQNWSLNAGIRFEF